MKGVRQGSGIHAHIYTHAYIQMYAFSIYINTWIQFYENNLQILDLIS